MLELKPKDPRLEEILEIAIHFLLTGQILLFLGAFFIVRENPYLPMSSKHRSLIFNSLKSTYLSWAAAPRQSEIPDDLEMTFFKTVRNYLQEFFHYEVPVSPLIWGIDELTPTSSN